MDGEPVTVDAFVPPMAKKGYGDVTVKDRAVVRIEAAEIWFRAQ